MISLNLRNKKVSGFTLVEMAIVLVIIGIILAGVMKGRDIVRGSQVKQFSQQFAQKWGTIAQTYYDKTGQILLDGNDNGARNADVTNGIMSGRLNVRINGAGASGVLDVCEAVGITPCTLIKSKLTLPVTTIQGNVTSGTTAHCNSDVNIVQTTVEGEYTGNSVVTVDLRTIMATVSGMTSQRNAVILFNVPTDVAQGLDTVIDGQADGESGTCIGVQGAYAMNAIPTAFPRAWNAVNPVTATAWDPASNGQVQTVGIILDY
ncbi:prepilin-type N-terminal cleavage/methylation domain-containing protein [Desulfovibrio ferrophilus]|uniref:Prepilin-type N-terminal cleavage/methylation domain-containing protein n=1 Tax=Desulfovibrio ferrophilus TaxID=241368 RepID=A0A2Z6AZQ3_9BACT|nr:prepilin-type N-terminal cleavage/methylation domain-containing protein [Desulfovibrio ferrophilus]BBD08714.1 uncharacterized protein DFE_1988 [Desulfovibrio ferrophilus]